MTFIFSLSLRFFLLCEVSLCPQSTKAMAICLCTSKRLPPPPTCYINSKTPTIFPCGLIQYRSYQYKYNQQKSAITKQMISYSLSVFMLQFKPPSLTSWQVLYSFFVYPFNYMPKQQFIVITLVLQSYYASLSCFTIISTEKESCCIQSSL